MNQGSHSQTPIVFGLIIVLSGRLVTKGETASCEFKIECGKPEIQLLCRFPPNATQSDKFSVSKIDGQNEIRNHTALYMYNTGFIYYNGIGTPTIKDPTRYNVTFSPVAVTVWITNAFKNDTGTYVFDIPHLKFSSICNLTENQIDDLKNCPVGSAQLTSSPASTSDSSSVSVSGHHRFNSTVEVFASSTSDNNASTDTLKAADADGEAGVGAGVLAGVLLLVSAVTVILICRRRRRENKNGTCHHSGSTQSQTSQKYVYSSLPSDAENGGARHDEESKRQDMILSEEVQRLVENNERRQADEQVLNSVIELMKGFANSPGRSDSYADTTDKAAMKTNVKTKLMCRRGVDGSLELSIENSVCSPDTFSEKESAIAGQEADRLKSTLKTCALAHRDIDLKTRSKLIQMLMMSREIVSDNQELKQTESKIVDSKRESEIRLEDVPEKHSLSQTSFPREELQSSHSFADDTHDLTGKVEQMQESPEASKMIHEQCQCSGNTQHLFEANITPDMPLSLLNAEKKYFQNNLEPDDIAEAESGSRVENIKVRPACV